ncbi:hypothetical protein [Pseudofrankia sp. BMG5.37]|uniref:hypothetical protein n=1 Tax=Pseudofrankia sp. BMG5.37 TaxID=3050035 RepID=UPI0028946BE1|nr:hypothetical protein [Pseudofrankia sp. BMG5.37]MDT3442556.1 hypothetical protein [Pseudofrankia sp. BMG5.37]
MPIRTQVIRRPSGDRWAALRDTRLQAWTAYDAVLSLWQPILNVAFPIWLATRTDAPLSLVGVLYTVAGVIAIALQYPAGKLATTPTRAVRGYAGAALCLAAASVGFAMASESSATFTVVALTVSVVLLTLGEITQVGSAWTVSFTIAPPDRRNAYLAAFSLGRAFSRAVGPLLMTGAVLALGRAGWLTLAAVFALAAVAPLLVTKQSALTSSTANEHDDTARAHERR